VIVRVKQYCQLLTKLCIATVLLLTALSLQARERIISTDAGTTNILAAVGLQTDLVGFDVTSWNPSLAQSNIANIGYHRRLSAEGLLSLQPTLVVGNDSMGPPEVITALRSANVDLLLLPTAHDLETLKANLQQLLSALALTENTRPVLQSLQALEKQLQQQQRFSGKRMAFLLQHDGRMRLAGKGTSGSALIALMGAETVGDFEQYREVSAESLLALQPEVILVASDGLETSAATALQQRYQALALTPAGKQGMILDVNSRALVAGLSIDAVAEAVRLSTP